MKKLIKYIMPTIILLSSAFCLFLIIEYGAIKGREIRAGMPDKTESQSAANVHPEAGTATGTTGDENEKGSGDNRIEEGPKTEDQDERQVEEQETPETQVMPGKPENDPEKGEDVAASEAAMGELEYEDIVLAEDTKYEDYYLYNFLYIGDSFIRRLAKSGIIHDSCEVLAKSGTAPRDWYVEGDNDRFVDYLETVRGFDSNRFDGIIINYGINDIKMKENTEYSKRLVSDIRKQFPKTPIFILKVMPVAEHFELKRGGKVISTSDDINRLGANNVENYNKVMEEYARQNANVWFVDAGKDFVDEKGYLKQEMADERGLHIADEYILKWCENIFNAVTRI